ncbi:response regulator [Nocardioides sp. MAHUQ-72]|uniref:response regulator n=1 Tax=unclassified Nocardioides TaxID=2615069 RepID=UPI00361F4796
MSIRVVIADDHPAFRFGLRAVLEQAHGIEVVGEAADGAALVSIVHQLEPDVVLSDLGMSDADGVTAIRTLTRTRPGLPVIAVTMHSEEALVRAALAAGARGYLLKGADALAIVRAVETAATGQTVLDATIGARLVAAYTRIPEEEPLPLPRLTARETDVLRLIARGHRNHEIARRLGLAEKTVRNITSSVLLKLEVPDRTAAALRAVAAGLDVEDP